MIFGGGGGSWTRVPTGHDEDVYMLVPSSSVFRHPRCQWTGMFQTMHPAISQNSECKKSCQGTDWRRFCLSTRSGKATWRDYAANAYSSFAVIVLTGDLRGQRSSSACNQPTTFAGRIRNTPKCCSIYNISGYTNFFKYRSIVSSLLFNANGDTLYQMI